MTPADAIEDMLGIAATQLGPHRRDIDLYQGTPHTSTGLAYAIEGTASVIQVKVGEYLAQFKDPIKAILTTEVHTAHKVLVTRKYVVGGRAVPTPEHAPAQTVSVREDVSEYPMTRYGADLEMNVNLFLKPELAKEELDMKVDAQKLELQRALIDRGYRMLMDEGVLLVDAIARSSPLYQATATNAEKMEAARRIQVQQVFGAMSKHPFPIQSLLTAAKCASAYTCASTKGSVLIIPHGVPDVIKYTRRETMVYEIGGPAIAANGKPIKMTMDDVFVDDSTAVKIMVHHPLPNFSQGYNKPSNQASPLQSEAHFSVFYPVADPNDIYDGATTMAEAQNMMITNLIDGGYIKPTPDPGYQMSGEYLSNDTAHYHYFLLRPKITAVMSSAILAAPGHETGSLLVGYPFTSVSTSSQEMMKVQLRVYLGSVLRRPDNVIVMKDVYFEGLKSGHKGAMYENYDRTLEASKMGMKDGQDLVLGRVLKRHAPHYPSRLDINKDVELFCVGRPASDPAVIPPSLHNDADWDKPFNPSGDGDLNPGLGPTAREMWPKMAYCGHVADEDKTLYSNTGHMGKLDSPDKTSRLYGSFVYSGSTEQD